MSDDDEVIVRRGAGPGLIEFIMARIDETEANAADSAPIVGEPSNPAEDSMRRYILAELQAKRERIFKIADLDHKPPEVNLIDLYLLEAQPWADHPDFNARWRQ